MYLSGQYVTLTSVNDEDLVKVATRTFEQLICSIREHFRLGDESFIESFQNTINILH